jgi:hypothetical protein
MLLLRSPCLLRALRPTLFLFPPLSPLRLAYYFAPFLHSPLSSSSPFSRSLSLSRVASFATSLGLVAFASASRFVPPTLRCPLSHLTCKPTKIPRQRKRKPNNKEDQIYFEVLEGAISWRYLPKFLISVLFFRRFFCFIAYSHKSVRPSLISTPIEKGTTIPETDFDHQAIKLNKHQKKSKRRCHTRQSPDFSQLERHR